MVFDYENLLVIGVLFDLKLKNFGFGWFERDLREIFEFVDEKWGNKVMPVSIIARSVS